MGGILLELVMEKPSKVYINGERYKLDSVVTITSGIKHIHWVRKRVLQQIVVFN